MPTSTRTTHARFYDTLRQIVIATRADRVVRPYRTLCLFAENACNFVIACRRVDVGIDPYRDFTRSPFVVRFCRCAPRGRGRTPPLRKIITSSLFTITSYLSCPAPTLRRNVATAQNVQPFSSSVSLRLPPSPHGEGSWHCESTGNFKSLLCRITNFIMKIFSFSL